MDSEWSLKHVTARAPGKVSPFLSVGRVRADGSHPVASLSQAVSLYDTVTATAAESFSVTVAGAEADPGIPQDARNTALRAARLLAAHTGYRGGVSLHIDKGIPGGAGLCGSAADAAAALLACNDLWGTGVDRSGIMDIANRLGDDVPFALEGGTAVGTGHGDELSQALSTGVYHWVIALTGRRLSEDGVVEQLDEHRYRHRTVITSPENPSVDTGVLQAVRSGCPTSLAEQMHNDLQVAALKLSPGLAELLELGESRGALAGITSASAPAIVFLTAGAHAAGALALALHGVGVRTVSASGPVSGARLVRPRSPRRLRG